ncbi:CLIP domain-containing serine protease B15-like [Leguminivora glycinivorella]|uniref:CLIP domain-containing serine protease B15-like n=1 Tax=Leguminivora glycinivorella TaxID=1035111 RepID=UPI00200D5B09|nr:CLIP domain-containing serine protease B15-like [Leguminivora glycinivorella]
MYFKISLLLLLLSISSSKSKMEAFIVGGKEVDIGAWPFIAFIESSHIKFHMVAACGGSLLSSQTVLTAAHCLDDVTDSKTDMSSFRFRIYMGHSSYHRSNMIRLMRQYETPSEYDPHDEDVKGDIGIIFLASPVKFSPSVKKVILFDQRFSYNRDRILLVAGWGKTGPNMISPTSPHLKNIRIHSISPEECKKEIPFIDVSLVVCTAAANEYAYSGDSGGPMVKRGSRYQLGVVSFRHEDTGITVFTSVPEYYDWIQTTQLYLFTKNCK